MPMKHFPADDEYIYGDDHSFPVGKTIILQEGVVRHTTLNVWTLVSQEFEVVTVGAMLTEAAQKILDPVWGALTIQWVAKDIFNMRGLYQRIENDTVVLMNHVP